MSKRKIPKAIKSKPHKGFKFLKSIPVGRGFVTPSGMKGIVLSQNIGSVLCKFTEVSFNDRDDANYYLGKHRISPETNVKQTKENNDARRV